jgi:hypothetical protein
MSTQHNNSQQHTASLEQVQEQLDQHAKHRGFSCKYVSWEDVQRTNNEKGLSKIGPNIADVTLNEKSGKRLFTVRYQNWNERLGYESSKKIAVVVRDPDGTLHSITLADYLDNASKYGGYSGLKAQSLADNKTDNIFSVRFQLVFLPVESAPDGESAHNNGKVEFVTSVYNYFSTDNHPRNLLLLCTSQGTSIQQDGTNTKQIFHHEVDEQGKIHRYWLEAEQSSHRVGGSQQETEEERADALARGKSVAMYIGTQAMSTRFNAQMLIQLPVETDSSNAYNLIKGTFDIEIRYINPSTGLHDDIKLKVDPSKLTEELLYYAVKDKVGLSLGDVLFTIDGDDGIQVGLVGDIITRIEDKSIIYITDNARCDGAGSDPVAAHNTAAAAAAGGGARAGAVPVGQSNAARVSRGTKHDTWGGLNHGYLKRDSTQHGTITVTMYSTVAGGVPSSEDIARAIDDLEQLYSSCKSDKRLVDCYEITSKSFAPSINLSSPFLNP